MVTIPVTAAAVAAAPVLVAEPAAGEPGDRAVRRTRRRDRRRAAASSSNAAPGVLAPPKIKAASYLIADADTGEVLAAKDPHGRYLPASTIKTLTALTLIPKLDPNRLIRPSQKACDVEGTKVGLTPKMQYKISDLFHAMLMMSANDAAFTLAEADGGVRRRSPT